jgi:dCMP deaminase
MDKWLDRYFDLANHVAQWSKDPTTKVGAVIVGHDKREIAVGFNGFPSGVKDTDDRLNSKPMKYIFTQHAERNVLDNALFNVTGATLIATKFPCSECAKSIISRKIAKVVSPAPEGERWVADSYFSKLMFEEAGVSWEEKTSLE